MRQLTLLLVLLALSSCKSAATRINSGNETRGPSSNISCEEFNALSAQNKQAALLGWHLDSAEQVGTHIGRLDIKYGGTPTLKYVEAFVGGHWSQIDYFAKATLATIQFLAPGSHASLGFKTLGPTLTRSCDFFETPQTKMVHALGTMAPGHMKLYDQLMTVNKDGSVGAPVPNPWTGLFNASANGGTVPMMIRFSIANPMAGTVLIGDKSLSLEFIPGLGLKFLVDGRKSVDLLAMESLAGQGNDQNYFKYEFSPDFSAHAPADFNTAKGIEKSKILARYDRNPVNHYFMNLVGKRFTMIASQIYGINLDQFDPHSNVGPHGFIISIQNLAAVDRFGHDIPENLQKRPWRLVFRPAIDRMSYKRDWITASTPYSISDIVGDFRHKLANLEGGDVVYYVEGETRSGKRYRMGEIVLESAPFPSMFADNEFFIHHDLEMNRRPGNDTAIADP